jgi:outer membrane biosynthesis protein TonB
MATPVALYARSSPDLDLDGIAIERQLADLRAFAAVRGWEVIEELEDPGLPPLPYADRSALSRARSLLRDGSVRGIVAWRLDLLVNDVGELQRLLVDAEEAGGFISTLEDSIDTSHAAGRAIGRAVATLGAPEGPQPGADSMTATAPASMAAPEPGPEPAPAPAPEPQPAPAPAPEPGPEPAPMPAPEPQPAPAPAPEPGPEPQPATDLAPAPDRPATAELEEGRVVATVPEVALGVLPAGIRPYGLTSDWSSVVQGEAQVIRTCHRRLHAGATLGQLARRLNRRGIRTSTGGRWRANQLGRTLSADYLAGIRIVRGVPTEDGVLPVIVTRGELQRVRELLADRGWGPRAYRRHLLAGLVRCGRCGEPLVGRPRRGRARRYVCGRPPIYRGCGRVRIAARPVEQLVEEALIHALSTPQVAAAVATAVAEGVPIPGYAALSISPRETWPLLSLESRRAVLRLLIERVDVATGGIRRRFDPSRVEIAWRY